MTGEVALKKFWWLAGLALVMTLAPALSSPLPAAASVDVDDGGTFNLPAPWGTQGEKYRILRRINKAIDRTPPHTDGRQSRIYVATFLLDRASSVDALIRACRRGVSVRVVLDADILSSVARRLERKLNGDNVKDRNRNGRPDKSPRTGPCGTKKPKEGKGGQDKKQGKKHGKKHKRRPLTVPQTWGADRSYVIRCKGSCRGGSAGNMHSKFYLFSRVHKVRDVVMLGSTNLNRGSAVMGWNDLWTIKQRPRTFNFYARIHRQMTQDRRHTKGRHQVTDGPYRSRVFPRKNAGRKDDPTLRDLSRVRCRGPLGRTRVHVSMFYWAGERGNYIATELLDLAREGCRVSVIYGAPSRQIAKRLRAAAGRHLIALYDSRWDHNRDGFSETRSHAKYVLVRGVVGKQRRAYRVVTGAQNWVAGSLRLSDENTLSIASRDAYASYLSNWKLIRQHSRRLPYRLY